ncbi:phosphoserine phosphatase SerB [Pseudoalteromonas sp.]|uniref:phosphoserine phosphatase SerB n=1 Tax=Pseudoalteromonas sp. TaxID=53249 RepID=UPI003563D492
MFKSMVEFEQLFSNIEINKWHLVAENGIQESATCYVLLTTTQPALKLGHELIATLQTLPVVKLAKISPHADLPNAFAFYVNAVQENVKEVLKDFLTPDEVIEVNVFSQAPNINHPGLLVMDMDSTAIQIECIDEIARLAGVYDEVATVTRQAMQGALPFSESLRKRVAKLEGVSLELMAQLKDNLPLMPGVKDLCQYLKTKGWKLAIASGGFVPFAERVQNILELDAIHANTLEDNGFELTGKVLGKIVDAEEKARFLTHYASELNLPISQTIAMGDGANDLVMMAASGLGVAVHGKPLVAETADVAVNFGSLLQVLYFISLPE